MSDNTSLVPLTPENALDFFKPNGLDSIIEKIRKEVKSYIPDLSSDAGRKQISSMSRKVASAKVAIDDIGKDLTAELKAKTGLIDAERKRMRDIMDALRDEVRQPLTEWEEKEEQRTDRHKRKLEDISGVMNIPPDVTSKILLDRYQQLAAFREWDFEEFAELANTTLDTAEKKLLDWIDTKKKAEEERAELERLRVAERDRQEKELRENQERIQREREDQIRKEAEEKARRDADERAKADIDRAEREKQEAEAKAKKAEEDKIAAAKLADEQRRDAEEKAERDRKAAEEKAKQDQEAAVQRERDRQEEIRRQEAIEIAKREADKKHRSKINNAALNAIVSECNSEAIDITPAIAKAIIEAIAKGKIPNVKISY